MRFSRLMLTGSTLLALTLVGGCSGGDGDNPSSADPSETEKTNTKTEERTDCQADVKLTGAVKAKWSGKAFVITENRNSPVLYRAAKGKNTLTLLAADDNFDALGTLKSGKKSYTTGSGTVKVDPEGSGAEVDADADGVHIVADFSC